MQRNHLPILLILQNKLEILNYVNPVIIMVIMRQFNDLANCLFSKTGLENIPYPSTLLILLRSDISCK